jgi:Xaa-Pro aminopeptidase
MIHNREQSRDFDMLMNVRRLFARMKRDGMDAVVATSPENVTYASGFWPMSQWIRRGPQNYVLVPGEGAGEPCIVASTGLIDLIADRVFDVDVAITDVRRYGMFAVETDTSVTLDPVEQRLGAMLADRDHGDAIAALVGAIKERGLERATIGVDDLGILPVYWDRLREALPQARIVRANDVFRHARAVKTPDEVERLRRAAHIAEHSIDASLAVAKEGATEIDMALAFHGTTVREQGVPVLGCLAAGPHTAFANVQPSLRKIRHGDIIRFDVGGRYNHYRADIARNAVLGEPSDKLASYHGAIRAGLMRAIEMVKPGVRAADIFEQAVETVRREGIPHYKRNHVGHGIGLDGYDAPDFSPSSKEVLEEGMVVCLETPYYELGFGGLQVEDMIRVTADGFESLMSTGSELRVL